jgi:hypothetical protein
MPIYTHVDKKTSKVVEILRNFDQHQDSPTQEEALIAGLTEEEFQAAEFEKRLGRGIKVVRGDNWGPGKGHWLFPLLIGGVTWLAQYQDMIL